MNFSESFFLNSEGHLEYRATQPGFRRLYAIVCSAVLCMAYLLNAGLISWTVCVVVLLAAAYAPFWGNLFARVFRLECLPTVFARTMEANSEDLESCLEAVRDPMTEEQERVDHGRERFVSEYNRIHRVDHDEEPGETPNIVYQRYDVTGTAKDQVEVPTNEVRVEWPVVYNGQEVTLAPVPEEKTVLKKLKSKPSFNTSNRLVRFIMHQIQGKFGRYTNSAANQMAVRRFANNLADGVVCGSIAQKHEAVELALQFAVFPSPAEILAAQQEEIVKAVAFYADAKETTPYAYVAPPQ